MKALLSIMILLYVDDMIVTGDDTDEIIRLQEDLSVCFEMKSLGEAHCFLDLELELSDGYLLSQQGYAPKILKHFGMERSNSTTTPMDPGFKLQKNEGEWWGAYCI